jgi:uncharacterized repeat protein (TIGR01451 family)
LLIAVLAGLLPQVPGAPAQPAWAAIRNNNAAQPFGSVVDCIETGAANAPRFASSCFGSAWDSSSYAGPGNTSNGDAPGTNAAIYSFGDAQPDGSADLVTAGQAVNGHAPAATLQDVGAVYGLAFSAGRNPVSPVAGQARLYSGAFTKRLTRFGPGGPGAIYVTSAGSSALYITIPGVIAGPANAAGFAANGQPGDGSMVTFPNGTSPAAGNYTNAMGGIHSLQSDNSTIAWAGASGLGDLDIDPQEHYLYVVNLRNRLVYRIDTWNASPQSTVVALPAPPEYADPGACNASGASGPKDLRPFGLLVTGDSLYLGFTCTAQSSQDRRDLAAGVLRYDMASAAWAGAVMGVALPSFDAQRQSASFNSQWRPWRDDENGDPFGPVGPSFRTYPQALVADVELSEQGDLLFGLRDRYADMTGSSLRLSFAGTSQGDILAAPRTGPFSWGAPSPAAEYFGDNAIYPGNGDPELAGGALALIPGTHSGTMGQELIGTFMNPYGAQSYGAAWWNSTGGAPSAREELYTFGSDVTRFGKAAGLGDVEILCEYRSVGDRVWRDANGNGVQDAGEPDIDGVLINLRDASGTLLAQVRSGSTGGMSGNYRFYVQPFQSYSVEIDPSNFVPGGALAGYGPTLANAGADDVDSDIDAQSRMTIPPAGNRDVNMTFDAGFSMGANVRVDKAGPASAAVGDTISYSIAYANDGPSGATGVMLVDSLPPGLSLVAASPPPSVVSGQTLTWSLGTLAAGASGAITLNVRVDPSAAGSVVNQVSISTTTPGNSAGDDSDTVTTLIQRAGISVSKSGPASVAVGSGISYTLVYRNTGSAPATAVRVADTLPAGLSFVSSAPAPASISGQALSWDVGALAAGASGSIVVNAAVDGAAGGASISNQACASTASPGAAPASGCGSTTTTLLRPNVRIAKSGPPVATVGDQLTYSISYANTGGAVANGTRVVDVLPAGLSFVSASPAPASVSGQTLAWDLGALAPGASGAISVQAQSSAALASGALLRNDVTIATTSPGDDPSDNAASATTLMQRADVTIGKSSPASFPVASGEQVEYLIDYGNNGPAAALAVRLSDVMPVQLEGVSWSCVSGCAQSGSADIDLDLGMLAPGAAGRIRVVGTARTALAREDFANTASICTSTPQTRTDNDQATAPGAVWTADLQLVKLAAPQVIAGATFTATLQLRNNGPAPAESVTLVDTLPAGVTLVAAEPAPSVMTGGQVQWDVGDLGDGQSFEVELELAAAADLSAGALLVNQAAASTSTADRDTTNDRAESSTVVLVRADLQVSKRGPAVAYAGEQVEYMIAYTNAGPSLARAVLLTDTLPAELIVAGTVPPAAPQGEHTATWALGDLAPGQSGQVLIRAQSSAVQAAASIDAVDRAQITSAGDDPDPSNNVAEQTTALQTVDLRIVKDMPPFIVAGAEFTATLTYDNAGPLAARTIAVRDFVPTGLTLLRSTPVAAGPRWNLGTLAPGESASIALVLRAPSDAISGTTYLNTATIDTSDPDRDSGNNVSSDSSIVRLHADLSVRKDGTPGPVRTGEIVSYTLTYHNAGPSTAPGVRLVDRLPDGFELLEASPPPTTQTGSELWWELGDLASGATGSIEVRGVLRGAPGETATLRANQAEIIAAIPDPDPSNNRDRHDIVVQQPDLSVSKDDGQNLVAAGAILTYTIRLRNNGPVAARNVTLREEPPPGSVVLSPEWARAGDGSYLLSVGDLAPGATLTRAISIRLPHPLDAAVAVNRVVAQHADPDPTPDDNQDEDVDQVLRARIGDRVWRDDNADGQQDAGEIGLGGVVVRVVEAQTQAQIAAVTTDATGVYIVSGLRPGSYEVQLAPETTQLGPYRGFRPSTDIRQVSTLTMQAFEDLQRDFGIHPAATTAVTLAELRAESGADGLVTVSWRTLDEIGTDRFRVLWSATSDRSTAVEIASLPARASTGARYSVSDHHPAGYYWLIEVERGGAEHLLGLCWPPDRAPLGSGALYLPDIRR